MPGPRVFGGSIEGVGSRMGMHGQKIAGVDLGAVSRGIGRAMYPSRKNGVMEHNHLLLVLNTLHHLHIVHVPLYFKNDNTRSCHYGNKRRKDAK
jgi:hypothetical protein